MCEYCENKKILMSFDESLEFEGYVGIKNRNKLEVSNDFGVTQIEINYCPMCGRNLKECE